MPARRRLSMLHRAGKASYRASPVTSTLGLMFGAIPARTRMYLLAALLAGLALALVPAFLTDTSGQVGAAIEKEVRASGPRLLR